MSEYKTTAKIYINAHSIFKYNQPKTKITTSIYKTGAWLFIIPFKFGYVHIINSCLNKCIY